MPKRYVIHTRQVPSRFKAITRSGVIVSAEKCMGCVTCVKKQCVYGVYKQRGLDPHQMLDSTDVLCRDCFRCVQGCPRELYQKAIHPEYLSLGDAYWTPDIITRLWYQAETGRIPVSGGGYSGPFAGPGFDSIWTDMSEIVRPTRDGIHGREYISTAVRLGRKPPYLTLTEDGENEYEYPPQIDLPLPILFQLGPFGYYSHETLTGIIEAAAALGTLVTVPFERISGIPADLATTVAYRGSIWDLMDRLVHMDRHPRLAEFVYDPSALPDLCQLKHISPNLVVSMVVEPVPYDSEGLSDILLKLVEAGVDIIHLAADIHGEVGRGGTTEFISDVIRNAHVRLVEEGLRDQVSLLASGGLAMAEHVAKVILCGADAVVIDLPLLVALGCRICKRCTKAIPCPAEIETASSDWVAARIVNLIAAWHNQLLEVMGAMGMREVQRLRGEVGRVMFFEELDRELFGSLGTWKEHYELG